MEGLENGGLLWKSREQYLGLSWKSFFVFFFGFCVFFAGSYFCLVTYLKHSDVELMGCCFWWEGELTGGGQSVLQCWWGNPDPPTGPPKSDVRWDQRKVEQNQSRRGGGGGKGFPESAVPCPLWWCNFLTLMFNNGRKPVAPSERRRWKNKGWGEKLMIQTTVWDGLNISLFAITDRPGGKLEWSSLFVERLIIVFSPLRFHFFFFYPSLGFYWNWCVATAVSSCSGDLPPLL